MFLRPQEKGGVRFAIAEMGRSVSVHSVSQAPRGTLIYRTTDAQELLFELSR